MHFSTCRGGEFGSAADHKRSSTMPSQGSLFTNFEDVQVSHRGPAEGNSSSGHPQPRAVIVLTVTQEVLFSI